MVRFGVDACLPSPDSSTTAMSINDSAQADVLSDVNNQQLSISTMTPPAINIVCAGTQVLQDTLVKMISCSVFYLDQVDWNELYLQLVLTQTPLLRLGVHRHGKFIKLHKWMLDGHDAQVDAGTPRHPSWAQGGGDVLDLSVQCQKTAVQVVRLAKVLQVVQKYAITCGSGPAGSFSFVCVCERQAARVCVQEGWGWERWGWEEPDSQVIISCRQILEENYRCS
jgi:hypothetical protein